MGFAPPMERYLWAPRCRLWKCMAMPKMIEESITSYIIYQQVRVNDWAIRGWHISSLELNRYREAKGFIQVYTGDSTNMIFMYARWVNTFC
jgi:hypothetical protein